MIEFYFVNELWVKCLLFTLLNDSRVQSIWPYPCNVTGCCVLIMKINSIRFMSIEYRYQLSWPISSSNNSNWFERRWPNSQATQITMNDQNITSNGEISSMGFDVFVDYHLNRKKTSETKKKNEKCVSIKKNQFNSTNSAKKTRQELEMLRRLCKNRISTEISNKSLKLLNSLWKKKKQHKNY